MSSVLPRERSLPLQLTWPHPDNKERIVISDVEKTAIENFLKYKTKEWNQRSLQFHNISKNEKFYLHKQNCCLQVPLSITFLYDQYGSISAILLMLNSARGRVVGKGTAQTPKTCYDLISGNFYVKKRIEHDGLCSWMRYLHLHPLSGVARVVGFREKNDKAGKVKKQYFEELYEATLTTLIRSGKLQDASDKLFVIRDLLQTLANLHALQKTQFIKFRDAARSVKEYTHSFFHHDLKTDNIFVNGRSVHIGDFGLSNVLLGPGGTPPQMSPTIVKRWLRMDERKNGPNKHHQTSEQFDLELKEAAQHGCSNDMWSLALIFISILMNRFSLDPKLNVCQVAPFKAIERPLLTGLRMSPNIPNRFIAQLTQAEIDIEIRYCQEEATKHPSHAILVPLWSLVGHMLKVNPSETISACQALQHVNEIIEESQTTAKLSRQFMQFWQDSLQSILEMKEALNQYRAFALQNPSSDPNVFCNFEKTLLRFGTTVEKNIASHGL